MPCGGGNARFVARKAVVVGVVDLQGWNGTRFRLAADGLGEVGVSLCAPAQNSSRRQTGWRGGGSISILVRNELEGDGALKHGMVDVVAAGVAEHGARAQVQD